MKVGQWPGCVADWGIGKSKEKGTPFVCITVSIDVDGSLESIDWMGYLTEAAKGRTIETLYKLGFNGDLAGLANGRNSGCIEGGKEIVAVIENEPYDGKDQFKVKWLNVKGETHGIPKVDSSEGLSILNAFKADFMAAKPKKSGLDL
jgi:hypothetical protein